MIASESLQCYLPDMRDDICLRREYDQEDDGGAGEDEAKYSHLH